MKYEMGMVRERVRNETKSLALQLKEPFSRFKSQNLRERFPMLSTVFKAGIRQKIKYNPEVSAALHLLRDFLRA